MRLRISLHILAFAILSIAFRAYAGECDDPKSSEAIAQCLGKDLRDSDAKINSSYKELMGKLSESDKAALRQAQRTWIKDRDSVCQLDTKERNREKWYKFLLRDYAKTVCVTRYTRQRTTQLDEMLTRLSPQQNNTPPRTNPAPPAPTNPDVAYDKRPATVHSNGKWYFELAVNYGETVKVEPCVLTVGVSDKQQFIGTLDNIRPRDSSKDILRYGFAVDLDNGKLYTSRNGAWVGGEPGSNQGQDLKLGKNYYASFMISADAVTPYLERKAIVPNFGDGAMTYALPAGYSPWRNKTVN